MFADNLLTFFYINVALAGDLAANFYGANVLWLEF